jgi:hypothetical protein
MKPGSIKTKLFANFVSEFHFILLSQSRMQIANHHFGAVVCVLVFCPPPSTLTLSSRPWKIKASPETVPRAGSDIFGGTAAVPVSTYSPVAPV